MIDFLTKPISDLLTSFGSGVLPSGGPEDLIRASSAALEGASTIGRIAVGELGTSWSGAAATAAIAKAEEVNTAAVRIADNGTGIAAALARASESVRQGTAELTAILQSLVGIAAAAAPTLLTPIGQTMLITAAIEHLERAMAVVARVQGELNACTADVTQFISPVTVPEPANVAGAPPPAASQSTVAASSNPVPSSAFPGSDVLTNFARSFASSAGSTSPPTMPSNLFGADASDNRGVQGPGNQGAGVPGVPAQSDRPSYDPRIGGKGVAITLPDGSTAVAPNEKAAGAVRSALTQSGVPYQWGGTQPGRGLDCSGLTQWAYGQEGVELPRLAQDQGVGATVSADDVMPGDLAVWDGHVAMIVGNGQMIEAGDPVEISPIRTSNSGMGFHGFYRPTEA